MNEVYYGLLTRNLGLGHALWIPEPNETLPTECRIQGVTIGDVGMITAQGGFDVLFNACHSATHPINQGSVPDNFIPLILDEKDVIKEPHRHAPGTVISSSAVCTRGGSRREWAGGSQNIS